MKIYSKHPLEITFLIFVVWSAGGAMKYQMMLYTANSNIFFSAIISLLCIYILIKNGIPIFNRRLMFLVLFLFVFGSLGSVLEKSSRNYFYIIYNLFIAYTLINVFKGRIFYHYERIIVFFSIVSLIAFFCAIIIPGFASIVHSFSFIRKGGLIESNVLLFGLAPIDPGVAFLFSRRNLGFAWEPGRFAVIVVIAIFFNLIRNKMQLRNNKNLWILLITLITTQSTTGYFCLIIPVFLYAFNTRSKIYIYPILSVFILATFSLPFMSEKLIDSLNWQKNQSIDVDEIVNYSSAQGGIYVPQRFEGLYYDYLNFTHDIWFGYGSSSKNSYTNKVLYKGGTIYASNGLMQIFAACGIVVGLIFYFCLYLSSKKMGVYFKYEGSMFFFILFTLVSFSYNFWFVTIFLTFVLYGYFTEAKKRKYHYRDLQRLTYHYSHIRKYKKNTF